MLGFHEFVRNIFYVCRSSSHVVFLEFALPLVDIGGTSLELDARAQGHTFAIVEHMHMHRAFKLNGLANDAGQFLDTNPLQW